MADAIHLLVSDVAMADLSARRLSKRLKELRPNLKVLFLSGDPHTSIREETLESSTALFHKPFTPTVLAHQVRRVLDKPIAQANGSASANNDRLDGGL
jgi:DNA-binding NarL/FixJ family response regulator